MLNTVSILFGFLFLFYLLRKYTPKPKNPNENKFFKLPPSPFHLPFIGNFIQLYYAGLDEQPTSLRDYYYERIFGSFTKKYTSTIIKFQVGSHPFVVLSSFEHMKELLCSNVATPRFLPDYLKGRGELGVGKTGIMFNNSAAWPKLRRLVLRALKDLGFVCLSDKKRKGKEQGVQVIRHAVLSYMSYIEEKLGVEDSVWKYDHQITKSMVYNVSWHLMTGESGFPLGDKQANRILYYCDIMNQIASQSGLYMLFPWLVTFLPEKLTWKHAVPALKEFEGFLNEKVKDIQGRKVAKPSECLITSFLRKMEENADSDKNNGSFNIEQLLILLQDLSFASVDTTSGVLRWIIIYLSEWPEIQAKVREEVTNALGNELHFDQIDINEAELLYTTAFLLEVIRHEPATHLTSGPPRTLTQDFILSDGFLLKKGTNIVWNIGLMFRDKGYWGDPESFRPERFLTSEEGNNWELKIHREKAERAMSLFGFGKRRCPGEKLAWNILFSFTVLFVKKFKITALKGPCDPKDFAVQIDSNSYIDTNR